ncbi:MAG: hypothetical protein MJZ07_02290 [Bacteroidales bacterium]|nr:hypothetical protein [Bacteroidales bacterium]
MKSKVLIMTAVALIFSCMPAIAQEQKEKEKSLEEKCEDEADRLQNVLKLEDWQVFYVDSILKHDYAALKADYDELQKSRVANSTLYELARDKWMEKIDLAYQKIFTPEQWAKYLKQGAGREIKAREKRRLKAQEATEATQEKGKKSKKK